MLKAFVVEHCLHLDPDVGLKPTFYGHSGASSQIDYILVDDSALILSVKVSEQSPTNMSSHVSVKARLNINQDDIHVST